MKRRTLGLLSSASLIALKVGSARAQTKKDPSLLKTTLTPMGAERAGNADGSIPAWDGGYTQVPSGWQPGNYMPDLFADEQPVVVIDAGNMASHEDRLSSSIMEMMKKYGFSIKVYPTHRTASAPQWVYDNIASNVSNAQLDQGGGRLGFTGGYGGVPFPIPDTSDPLVAGAQIVWNQNARWCGYGATCRAYNYVVNNGALTLSANAQVTMNYPYYDKTKTVADFSGIQFQQLAVEQGPPEIIGEQILVWYKTNPYENPNIVWQLLTGQARVRKAPEVAFDTPNSFVDGISNYDETIDGFDGSLEKYDWKYVGKKEMYIPCNNNALALATPEQVFLPHFVNPDFVRWELHRVWVVEATLHPGERNVMARRTFFMDEDTWQLNLSDEYDANGNLFHATMSFCYLRPELPGLVNVFGSATYNLQTDDYDTVLLWLNEKANPSIRFVDAIPDTQEEPQSMAASSQF